jgi:hypothetical protein
MLLNSDCSVEGETELTRWGNDAGLLEGRRNRYADQAQCVNALVIDAIDRYLAEYPDAIVMITADHGPGSLLDVNQPFEGLAPGVLDERMKILGAYRLQDCPDQPYPSISPVNGARLVANCALGTELGLLPDKNHWLDLDGEGVVREITELVQG